MNNDRPDIIQQFHSTKCYGWLRHIVEAIAVWILDSAITIFFFVFGTFLFAYMQIGFKVAIVLLCWFICTLTGWHAADWHILNDWRSAGSLDKLGMLLVGVSPLCTVMWIWGILHTLDDQ